MAAGESCIQGDRHTANRLVQFDIARGLTDHEEVIHASHVLCMLHLLTVRLTQ